MKRSWVVAASGAIGALLAAQVARSAIDVFVPKDGFVPDAATAGRIAEAIWIPLFGEKVVASEKPFKVSLHKDVWTVTATVTGKEMPDGWQGGVAEAFIDKRDGRILRVVHGQ